ncbi:putative glutathionylspermidine synthase [Capsulimonas corticalis]|uniref:Glutathionylspermidine synthase n=1 Tax=Capsulimonas corticalis TaxID=2219043 RepID=A0A402D255_9BACT|nr:glutathionylspermidine synthase family protein [Capsulimonas corticalis]BDI30138.1 putative glutathionylspermidine synthase [Capsulimonas corticalis]
MQRIVLSPRADWRSKVEALGLVYHTTDGKPYWNESAYYRFTSRQIDEIEAATNALHAMCLEAAQHVIDHDRFAELGVPAAAIDAIKASWEAEPPSLYGRFDLAYDGVSPPKMLEYNADTPTSLVEAAVVQWRWLEERFPSADQFNSIWEGLVEKWTELKTGGYLLGSPVHFTHVKSTEDLMTVTLLRDTAQEAGLITQGIHIHEIGWDKNARRFVDMRNQPIRTIFKLYPWEWLIAETFGQYALATYSQVQWIEPIWKLLLSSKGILPILWELYPNHPNLLEAHLGRSREMRYYVKKPLFSREGANVTIKDDTGLTRSEGNYGEEGYVFQALAAIPNFDGNRPVLGSWVIDGAARGMGVRESDGPITDNLSRFVPHLFE